MSAKFKPGDRVVGIGVHFNGDTGTIVSQYTPGSHGGISYSGACVTVNGDMVWWVDWDKGGRKFIGEQYLAPAAKFKPGDRVAEIKTGDTGTITAQYTLDSHEGILFDALRLSVNNGDKAWWVTWDDYEEGDMFIAERFIDHVPSTEPTKPMTLDEAIAHAHDKALQCGPRAAEHAQLAQWLTEYKQLKYEQELRARMYGLFQEVAKDTGGGM